MVTSNMVTQSCVLGVLVLILINIVTKGEPTEKENQNGCFTILIIRLLMF